VGCYPKSALFEPGLIQDAVPFGACKGEVGVQNLRAAQVIRAGFLASVSRLAGPVYNSRAAQGIQVAGLVDTKGTAKQLAVLILHTRPCPGLQE
jgi:hypothetical protein